MTAARPGDRATLTVLAMEAELTALGLLPSGGGALVRASRNGPAPVRPCGTPAAFRRHVRRGERPCGACRAAESARTHKSKRGAAA